MSEPTDRRRRSFGPVVLLGLAAAGLAATAATRAWVAFPGSGTGQALPGDLSASEPGTTYPLASALSLVLLAAWGVLLVTRGRVRRGFAVVAALAALGLLACVVVAGLTLPDSAVEAAGALREGQRPGFTGWFWTTAVVALVSVPLTALAVRLVPGWPEMGSRYDAPGARRASGEEVTSERDLWRALDDGHDPTA